MKNFHKNKNKRVDDPTPTPKSHNVLIGSWESSLTTEHTKIKKTKSHTRHTKQNKHTQDTKLAHIYKLAHSPKNTHQIKNKTTHIYKLTPPKTCINQPNNSLITTQ